VRRIIHADVLNSIERLGAMYADIAHVADIENTDAVANRHVLSDKPALLRIFDGHVPAIEIHHLGAHLAMDSV
jgi:hypothetical protein